MTDAAFLGTFDRKDANSDMRECRVIYPIRDDEFAMRGYQSGYLKKRHLVTGERRLVTIALAKEITYAVHQH